MVLRNLEANRAALGMRWRIKFMLLGLGLPIFCAHLHEQPVFLYRSSDTLAGGGGYGALLAPKAR